MTVSYQDVLRQVERLRNMRGEYLIERGWVKDPLMGADRWFKIIPWGRESTRRVEADLGDAVSYQAKHDGDEG